jgi:hypothetical protein
MKNRVPFGMLFEEPVSATSDVLHQIKYDHDLNISVVPNSERQFVPLVQEIWGAAATQTVTLVRSEATDQDPHLFLLMGTETFTEVRQETTDSDKPRHFPFLATETETKVRAETTDKD